MDKNMPAGEKWHAAWLPPWHYVKESGLNTPCDVAAFELEQFFSDRADRAVLHTEPAMGEAWRLTRSEEGYTVTGGKTGVLYGAYALISALRSGTPLPEGTRSPLYALRMLDCWDNPDGTIERGYAGRSLWFEGGDFRYDPDRIRALGRLLSSVGMNVMCLNNVNVSLQARELIGENLPDLAAFADILRPFGVRLMVAVDFSMPMGDGLDTADPCDMAVQAWWRDRADIRIVAF